MFTTDPGMPRSKVRSGFGRVAEKGNDGKEEDADGKGLHCCCDVDSNSRCFERESIVSESNDCLQQSQGKKIVR